MYDFVVLQLHAHQAFHTPFPGILLMPIIGRTHFGNSKMKTVQLLQL